MGLSREKVIAELKAAVMLAQEQGNPAAMIAGWREIGKMCGIVSRIIDQCLSGSNPMQRGGERPQ